MMFKTKIENAKVSGEDGKQNILALVKTRIGLDEVNTKINFMLKE